MDVPFRILSTATLRRQFFLKACLTADFSDFAVLERETEETLSAMGPLPVLVLAKASLELKLHRPNAALQTLKLSPPLKETPNGRALLADIALQLGRYKEARAGFEAARALVAEIEAAPWRPHGLEELKSALR
ncbi:MAG: hypothetical protein GY701_27180, partial [Sulfitobacter sp.]|nr:hypothetical protein [Sulfitobacter sp.]